MPSVMHQQSQSPIDNTMHGFELRSKLEGGLGLDVIEVGGRERVKLGFGVVELIRVGNRRLVNCLFTSQAINY